MREAEVKRKTNETDISCQVVLDSTEPCVIDTGIGFFNHMLELMAKHGRMCIKLKAEGDLYVDDHHTIEDCGIVLGRVFDKLLGDKGNIARYGTFFCPMDEALAMVSIDISGRPYLVYDAQINREKVGDMAVEMAKEFFYAFAVQAGMTMHVRLLYGSNAHHCLEAIFKAFGHALKQAVKENEEGVLSTKGVL